MQILICEKYLPFSREPGIKMVIPATSLQATFYPTRIEFYDLNGVEPIFAGALNVDLHQPEYPTVQLDLEKGCVRVWGDSSQGFYRYTINGAELFIEKGNLSFKAEEMTIDEISENRYQLGIIPYLKREKPPLLEKISMGCHRKQDWNQIVRRKDPAEILPLWMHMAQWIPEMEPSLYEGTASLIPHCCDAIVKEDRNAVLIPFVNMFQACFEGLFSPTLTDKLHQGFMLNPILGQANPLAMCVDGAKLIRSLFIQSEKESFKILPVLPTSFHCGRALHLRLRDKGVLDMEWTKKQIRRAIFHSDFTGELYLQFPKEVDSFRLRRNERDRGQLFQNGDAIPVEKDEVILLDRFQK